MLARNLHHVALPVRSFERSRKFYEDLLGLERAERPDLGLPGAWYDLGGAQLHIIQTPEGADVGSQAGSLTPLATHVALAIDDYATTLSLLKERGIEVLETSPALGQMWIRDPDGNVIELTAA